MKKLNIIIIIILSGLVLFSGYYIIKLKEEKRVIALANLSTLDKNIALSKYIYMTDRLLANKDISFFQMYDENNILNKAKSVGINSLSVLNIWIWENIKYKSDGNLKKDDYWQTPEETLKLKSGDCEDMALLFFDIAKNKLHINTKMVWIISPNSIISHMVVEYEDFIFDPTLGQVFWKDKYYSEFIIMSKYDDKKITEIIKRHRSK